MHPCKVLIIDDDRDDVEILSYALVKSGIQDIHNVNTASKAIEYLTNIENEEDLPKLIITDLYLPAKSGLEFISDLKNTETLSKIPIVLLSSLQYDMVMGMNNSLNDCEYIKKPCSYNEYFQVARFLNQRIVA